MASRQRKALDWLQRLRKDLGATVITDELIDQQARQVAEVAGRLIAAPGRAQILRDPVGTGKTAIALTTARLLLDEKKIDYLLIVAPNVTVQEQWQERSHALFPEEPTDKAIWRKRRLLVRTHQNHPSRPSPNPARTLVIVDEAHRGLQAEDNAAFQGILSTAKGAMVLLVTATPYQLTTAGFTTMLSVAGSGSTDENDALSGYGRAVANVLKHWEPTSGVAAIEDLIVTAEQRRDQAKNFLDRHLLPKTTIAVPAMPPLRPSFVPLGSWATAYAAARILPELLGTGKYDGFQRGLTSSSETVFTEQWAVGRHLTELRTDGPNKVNDFIDQLREALGTGTDHPKVAASVRWVVDQVEQGRHVVVFASWLPTQAALGDALRTAFGAVRRCRRGGARSRSVHPRCAAQAVHEASGWQPGGARLVGPLLRKHRPRRRPSVDRPPRPQLEPGPPHPTMGPGRTHPDRLPNDRRQPDLRARARRRGRSTTRCRRHRTPGPGRAHGPQSAWSP